MTWGLPFIHVRLGSHYWQQPILTLPSSKLSSSHSPQILPLCVSQTAGKHERQLDLNLAPLTPHWSFSPQYDTLQSQNKRGSCLAQCEAGMRYSFVSVTQLPDDISNLWKGTLNTDSQQKPWVIFKYLYVIPTLLTSLQHTQDLIPCFV